MSNQFMILIVFALILPKTGQAQSTAEPAEDWGPYKIQVQRLEEKVGKLEAIYNDAIKRPRTNDPRAMEVYEDALKHAHAGDKLDLPIDPGVLELIKKDYSTAKKRLDDVKGRLRQKTNERYPMEIRGLENFSVGQIIPLPYINTKVEIMTSDEEKAPLPHVATETNRCTFDQEDRGISDMNLNITGFAQGFKLDDIPVFFIEGTITGLFEKEIQKTTCKNGQKIRLSLEQIKNSGCFSYQSYYPRCWGK